MVQAKWLVCYAEILVYENWELRSSTRLPKTQQSVGLDARWGWQNSQTCATHDVRLKVSPKGPPQPPNLYIYKQGWIFTEADGVRPGRTCSGGEPDFPPWACRLSSIEISAPSEARGRQDIQGGKAALLAAQVCNHPILCMRWSCHHGSTPSACKYTHSWVICSGAAYGLRLQHEARELQGDCCLQTQQPALHPLLWAKHAPGSFRDMLSHSTI